MLYFVTRFSDVDKPAIFIIKSQLIEKPAVFYYSITNDIKTITLKSLQAFFQDSILKILLF